MSPNYYSMFQWHFSVSWLREVVEWLLLCTLPRKEGPRGFWRGGEVTQLDIWATCRCWSWLSLASEELGFLWGETRWRRQPCSRRKDGAGGLGRGRRLRGSDWRCSRLVGQPQPLLSPALNPTLAFWEIDFDPFLSPGQDIAQGSVASLGSASTTQSKTPHKSRRSVRASSLPMNSL